MMRRPRRSLALIAFAAAGIACADGVLGPIEVRLWRDRWDEREPLAYEYDVRRSCFCPPEVTDAVTVVVVDGAVTRRFYVATGVDVAPQYAHAWTDVDGIFDYLDDVSRRGPDHFEVDFDRDFGYPRDVAVNVDESLTDGGQSIEILAFRPALMVAPAVRAR